MLCLLLALPKPELGDDFGPAALGPFLLRDCVIGTCQPSLTTISTWLLAIAADLYMFVFALVLMMSAGNV